MKKISFKNKIKKWKMKAKKTDAYLTGYNNI